MNSKITSGFWHDRLNVNAQRAIFHQWEQLEASGCIENFRIAAGDVDGFREGWFFADSDAYKWLDAASRIYASFPNPELASVMDEFISLLARAQHPDGYLFTYNQIHFPDVRWKNLQIEHELYCHGHLIEAGVSHYEVTARTDLLAIARRAADRIVEDFLGKGPAYTPGHEEIEIALLRLYKVTNHKPYLEISRQFIEQRGRAPFFALSTLKQASSMGLRGKFVQQKKQEYLSAHPDFKPYQLPPENVALKPRNTMLRWLVSALSGKFFQQHAPVRKQTIPVGHSVRFGYLETAIAMLARESGDKTFLPALEKAWEHMVTRRMYITGGIGSLPGLEGFGNDYELDPEYAYAETCASLAGLFWNWEMAKLTGEAKYTDLFEWQLYNAAAVGMGLDGATYLFNNPLTCRGGVTRRPWYSVPCCPSNLSRTWADLGKYIYSSGVQSLREASRWDPTLHRSQETSDSSLQNDISIHQYISSQFTTDLAQIEMESNFPWDGKVQIKISPSNPATEFTIHLRLPSWSIKPLVKINNQVVEAGSIQPNYDMTATASGYDPRHGRSLRITRKWNPNDEISLIFNMPIILRTALPDVKGHANKIAVTRGPLVYCLESVDNPDFDIFTVQLSAAPFTEIFDPDLLGGTMKIIAHMPDNKKLTFIPYHLWGNRGESTMTVWINE